MPFNSPLTFRVAGRRDFVPIALGFFTLTLISAALSPQPVFLIILSFLTFGAAWIVYIIYFYKVNKIELISVIFPDGGVRLESGRKPVIKGFLCGQQWCTRHIAVLRFITHGKRRYLVLLSAQQNADKYRRLIVWLRQDFCHGSGDRPVPEV